MSDDKDQADAHVLYWSGKLFSAEDLRRHLTNQRELVVLPRTLLTPLALDELRAKGVGIRRQEKPATTTDQPARGSARQGWAYVQETPDPVVAAAAAALEREGLAVTALGPPGSFFANWFRSARERP
ncbi:MAG TPA: hypothetical protein VGZ47_16970, partial [Gemmataceae bacterium]|nr:hypothetical protein [Gemmataceae bacterium]